MHRVRLIHWNAAEAEERAAKLRAAGYDVASAPLDGAGLRALQADPPDAVVVDLSRLPAQGRDVAMALRKYKSTRQVALVFAEGDPEKVKSVAELLPDAVYTTWSRIRSSLKRAIAHRPADPLVPDSNFAAYSGTPLPKKLGIKANSVVALVGAPLDFAETLGTWQSGSPGLARTWSIAYGGWVRSPGKTASGSSGPRRPRASPATCPRAWCAR
jgi:CheY-like chemotaxis protein